MEDVMSRRSKRVVNIVPRIAAKRERERQRIDDELFALCRRARRSGIPMEELKLLLRAVVDCDPSLLEGIAEPWRQRAIEVFHVCMAQPSAEVLRFPKPLAVLARPAL